MKEIDFTPNTAILFVIYNCDLDNFLKRIISLSKTHLIIVIDNSENPSYCSEVDIPNIVYVAKKINTGLCKAVNDGIEIAKSRNIKKIIYFDQDSEVDSDLVEKLILSYEKTASLIPNLGVVGPYFVRLDKEPYAINLGRSISENSFIVPETITSGMVFSVELFQKVGGLLEDLFLDFADHEFCWRLTKLGYSIVIDTSIIMVHPVGTNYVKLGYRSIPVSSPTRNYYQMRNTVYLATRGRMINNFDAFKKLFRRLISSLIMIGFARPRLQRIYYFSIGFIDGISGKLGKLQDKV